jgi:glucan phosphoethanolaminetransferase (alkaline phosphatase superfamily)
MFDKIGNLPLHPLVIHAAVVGIPLACLLAFLFAFPKTRSWARWPLAIVVVGATAVTYVARQSGLAFEAALGIKPGNPVGDVILKHSQLANQLLYIMIVFTVVGLLNVFLVSRRTADDETEAPKQSAIVRIVLPVLLVAVAVVAFVWVVRVGDLGAHAVWNPTGTPLIPF